MADAVRYMNPFKQTQLDYRKAGWFGVMPLPYKQKHPPPTGYTGHRAEYPDPEKIKEWCEDGIKHNIGLRLAGVDKEKKYEIIGIDVDHYAKGNKNKKGGDQLQVLQARLGLLPNTWTSSSRTDGISGIRYYKVPRGLAFRGQIDKDIECISKGYRFAVVWPSVHPEGGTYWWFPPGVLPDSDGRTVWQGDLPKATELPILPDEWLDYLTQNRMKVNVDERIDMDSSVDEVYEWAYGLFHGDPESDHICRLYKGKIKKQIEDIKNEATSHDKIVKAHYNLLRLAAEGHVGWTQAIHEVEKVWVQDVIERDKRGLEELNSEVWRSRTNALRKIKAQIDERIKIGASPVDSNCEAPGGICECIDGDGDADGDDVPPDDPLDDVPRGAVIPVGEYRMNDDGNADHFVDMYSSLKIGPSIRFADGYGWIVWHEGKGNEQPHWQMDREGNQEIRRMWWNVRDRQEQYVEVLKQDYYTKLDQYDKQQPGVSKSDVEVAKRKYGDWKAFAEKAGNNYTANNAIKATQSRSNVTISVNDLNKNGLLIGVANGVLELSNDDVTLRPAKPDDYITLNTSVAWETPSDLAQNLWNNYLETFLPDLELRNITQIVMGHCLIGDNRQKKIIVLKGQPETGKSTMINAIHAALGDYASPINETVFQSSQFSEVLVNVLDKRVVFCSEFDSSIELSASVVKRLTGGDPISQAIKYSNEVREAMPKFTVILGTNNVPKIAGADKALQNRLFVIPFETKPQRIDRDQANVISEVCATAVLRWLVDGYLQYSRTKALPTSKLIEDKTEEFMAELDETATFLQEAVIKHEKIGMRVEWKDEPQWCVKREDLHRHYKTWCEINEIPEKYRLSPHMFTKRIRSLGVPGTDGTKTTTINGVSARWWYGMKIRKLRRAATVFQMPRMTVQSDTDEEK